MKGRDIVDWLKENHFVAGVLLSMLIMLVFMLVIR